MKKINKKSAYVGKVSMELSGAVLPITEKGNREYLRKISKVR